MTDDQNKRTTISLKNKPLQTRKGHENKRLGARARRVEQAHYQQQISATAAQTETVSTKPANSSTANRVVPVSKHAQKNHTKIAKPHLFGAFASCPQGLEQALFDELSQLGFSHLQRTHAGVLFSTDMQGIYRANLYSRIATRILLQLKQAKVYDEDELYEFAMSIAWEDWFGPEHRLRVDTSAIRSPMQSLQFCNLRVKDAICDRLRQKEGARPSVDTVRPDAKVHLFLKENQATLYLDSSGESLFKRGWRLDKAQAPIRENLAAGILALSGWQPGETILDPFCGSGTLLIEAAWQAQNVPPGLLRPFQFQRWRGFKQSQWIDVKEQARAQILPRLETALFASDINPNMQLLLQQNLQRANLSAQTIQFRACNALDIEAPASSGHIITNPPYGERLDDDIEALWHPWSAVLKQRFDNWQAHIITSDLELPKKLRLKPQRRHPLYNGKLDCRLFTFTLVKDSFRKEA
nr:THUMP domain-containing protein [Brackiella oedipodis]